MGKKSLTRPAMSGMTRMAWAVPAAIVIGLVMLGMRWGVSVPVPFLTLLTAVTIAGAMGGQRAGAVAGTAGALFVVYSYAVGFGPASLTGTPVRMALGSALFVLTGTLLGRLRDERDASIRSLRESRRQLAARLEAETEEKARQVRKAAESETLLNTAIRLAGIGLFSFEAFIGRCTYCSEQHAANLGMSVEEYLAIASGPKPRLTHIHPDDRAHVMEAIDGLNAGRAQSFEFRVRLADGSLRYIRQMEEPKLDAAGRVTGHVGMSMDLTELRLAEARVRQSQRIEAIGTLTGGVAHDFNNLLAVILGNLELCLETELEDERRDFIEAAIGATNRGADLTRNLLSFARRAHLEPKRLNLNAVIRDTMTWGRRVLPETIAVEHSLMAGLWDVEVDPTSAETALINILLNARDAMPEGGKVTIETANMRIGEEYLLDRFEEEIAPGRYVMLAVSDTGHGIPEAKRDRIFEPFYTGKPVGQGSGLGLSMVQGFVRQSGGAVRVYSEVGVGTTFKLYFRAAEQQAVRHGPAPVEAPAPLPGPQRSILVAEDEEAVRVLLRRVLEGAGYAVTVAGSGDMALDLYRTQGGFDLLLTDIVMPGSLQGPTLAKAIRALDPEVPCVFLSGYAAEAVVHGNGLKPSDVRLMKPASRDDLLAAVARALRDAPTRG